MTDVTQSPEDVESALKIARALIDAGIPVFAAPPCAGASCSREKHRDGKTEYDLPSKWQLTVPSHVWLKRWQPGWALGAVCGAKSKIDGLDVDPRSGGDVSLAQVRAAGHMPRVFGVQETPSGGEHYLISPLGERETNRFMPGLDYQGGDAAGQGRSFLWIAPTAKRSKAVENKGEIRPYRWVQEPDLALLAEFEGSDDSGEELRARILSKGFRAREDTGREGDFGSGDSGLFGVERRQFTEEEARAFCGITLERLERAEIGEIEECANAAAMQLSHFVPEFWSEDFAFAVLMEALSKTAYDPNGPSNWTAEKFRGRGQGGWKAERKVERVSADAVDALLAEMLTPAQVKERPRPRALIKGLLNLDSESWIIGPPGSKKSFVVLDMAGAVAAGRDWQGHKVHGGPVVLVVAEGSGGLGGRVQAYERLHGPMSDRVHILPRPVQARDAQAWRVLVEACRRLEPALIVIDTQARSTVGLEENSAMDMGVYIEAVRSAREATGACVLSVHHTGRKGGDARGSSAIDGAQYTELKVESDGLSGSLSTEKQKDMEMAPVVPLRFESVQVGVDEDGDPVTSLALVADAFRAASGLFEAPVRRGYVPEFGDKDRWRRRILDVLFLHAPAGIGMTKSEVAGQLTQAGEWAGKGSLARNGSYSGAWKALLEARDPAGDEIVIMHGSSRFEIGSEVTREGLAHLLGQGGMSA